MGAGCAPFFLAEIRSAGHAAIWIPALRRAGIRLTPLGGGSNFIGSDTEYTDRLFLRVSSAAFSCHEGIATAGAGIVLRTLLQNMRNAGYGGTAPLSGIPGTLGGALFMNAGANGVSISDFLIDMELLDLRTGEVRTASKAEFPWEYRRSGLGGEEMILSARLRFPVCTAPEEEKAAWETEALRRSKMPKGRSAGSIFKNPGNGLPPAGRLLEEAGAKGMRQGSFVVSQEHANWIVNDRGGNAAAQDLIQLVRRLRELVYTRFSVTLTPEVRFVDMNTAQNKEQKLKVLVVMGGVCSEREISLKSGANVSAALKKAGYDVRDYDIHDLALTDDMTGWADVVFPVLHGGYGEDGRFQELLERAGICFVGPSSASCRTIMDKMESKRQMEKYGIRTPAWAVVESKDAPLPANFELPLIVKPNSNGSTFGVTLVENAADWKKALEEAFRYDDSAFVEEFIQGKEGSVSVVDGKVLPIIEIQFPGKIYDYDAKYNAQSPCRHLCPPETMTAEEQADASAAALAYAKAVGAESLVRVDFISRRSDGKAFILEGNGLPGMTETSLLPCEAKAEGISLPELCSNLVQSALKRKQR